jgi:6-pyruvoyltetrahydropterin/6-carboxytetrahydropterin synthase
MIRVTRRYRFSASHRLHSEELSEADNQQLYGKCNNPHGHGHDYVLEVAAKGPLDASTGRVLNPATLDGLVAQYVLKDLDNSNLNQDLPDFAALVPTSENLTVAIEQRLQRVWKSAFTGEWPKLDAIRLRETKRNGFERLA